jgi:hypothetical protein
VASLWSVLTGAFRSCAVYFWGSCREDSVVVIGWRGSGGVEKGRGVDGGGSYLRMKERRRAFGRREPGDG